MVLPTTNETLRLLSSHRIEEEERPRERQLIQSVEDGLIRIILKEIDFQRCTEAIKLDLKERVDFSVKGAFDLVDTSAPFGKI